MHSNKCRSNEAVGCSQREHGVGDFSPSTPLPPPPPPFLPPPLLSGEKSKLQGRISRPKFKVTDGQTDRQTDRDRQTETDRQTDRQAERERERERALE